ncbi:major facilitator superfamily domain-containing protein [Phycomyces blakesleeanus]
MAPLSQQVVDDSDECADPHQGSLSAPTSLDPSIICPEKYIVDCNLQNESENNSSMESLGPYRSTVPAIQQVKLSLHASGTVINATISLYIFTLGVAVRSTVGCALSSNIGLFVAMRALQAVGASAAQAVGAGTVSDLFMVHERGNAMGLFFLGPLVGPVVGPIAGGYISEYLGWNYIFWFLSIMGAFILILLVFFLPETSPIIIKKRVEAKQRLSESQSTTEYKSPPHEQLMTTFMRPFRFLCKPVVLLVSLPYALAYGFMYFMISSLPHQLAYKYGFSSSQIGLAYLANGLGNVVGAVGSGKYADWLLKKLDTKQQERTPEARLSPMWLGISLLVVGELVYGWCVSKTIHIGVVLTGLFIFGLGVGVVQTPSNLYLVDAYQEYSASVISASNLLRCTMAACTPLLAPTILRSIGSGWAMTILASLTLMSTGCVFSVSRWGENMRYKYAKDHS